MATSKQCAGCGQIIPGDAPAGQCPNCLLEMVFQSETPGDSWPGPFDVSERRFGDYILGRQIGAGGMGVVYEAEQLSRKRKVALKLIRDAHGASPVLLCRFTIEAEAAARLDHPNIVRVYEVGEFNGNPFFSMDLVAGESLSVKITKKEFPFDWGEAQYDPDESQKRSEIVARLMVKVARAVQHAHERGVLHRDLKPANILIDEKGEPRLTDFGLAKIQADEQRLNLTTPANLPGTPHYMSPEQVTGYEATRASDIYGLGAVLYELLSGQPPFRGATPLETFKQILEQPPVRLRRVNRLVPKELETICLKCLEKDPRYRYSSAESLAQDLENWLARRPIRARPVSTIRRVKRWTKRNPIGAALIVTLCLGLTVSLLLLRIVTAQREQITLERDRTFEESMNKINLLWKEPERNEVTISAQELAIMGGRPLAGSQQVSNQICFGISTEGSPSSIAQWYAQLFGPFQQELQKELGERVVFNLKIFKRYNRDAKSLANGDADLMVLSAVDYVKAKASNPDIQPIGRGLNVREGVIFAHSEAGIQQIRELAGKRIAFPDPDHSLNVWAKARLAEAGLRARNFTICTNILDQELPNRETVISLLQTVTQVLRREVDAGVTYRERFELKKHYGLIELNRFPETPMVLAARKGLPPKTIAAMQKIIHLLKGGVGFDSTSCVPGVMVPAAESDFDSLRQALLLAEKFDAHTVASQ